jgi:hypothetical protein
MSNPTGGELSPGTAPSSSPSPAPSAPSSPATPPERKPSAPNPRAGRQREHWSDKHTGEGRFLAASRARREAAEPPSPSAAAAPGEQPAPVEIGPIERTEEGRFKFGEISLSEQEIRDLLEHKAADDSRRASLPSDPSGYELKLPSDFVVPPGIEFSFNPDDPRARLAREFSLEAGLSQTQFERLIAIDAARQVEEIANFNRMVGNEVKKLGATGTQRVTAIQNFLRGSLGDELARPFIETLVSERMVKGWEQIIQRITGQGAGSFSHAHREAPESNGIPGYDKMTFEQRLAAGEALRQRNQR